MSTGDDRGRDQRAPEHGTPELASPLARTAVPSMIGLAAGALYLWTFPVDSDGLILGNDVVPYARALESGDREVLFHPHHLAFHPLVAAVRAALDLFGAAPSGIRGALRAHQVVSAAGGAVAVALVFAFARSLCGAGRAALLAAVFALAAGQWLYASVGETYVPATAAVAGLLTNALGARLGLAPERPRIVALWLLAAVLLRQDGVLVVPALLPLLSRRTLVRSLTGAGAAALALYAAGWLAGGGSADFLTWLRGLSASSEWGRAPDARAFRIALGLTVAAFAYAAWFQEWSLALAPLGLLVLALVPSRRIDSGRSGGPGRPDVARGLAACALFALARYLFFTWWQPGNMEFHAGALLPLALAAALLIAPGRRGTRGWGGARQPVLLAACAAALAFGNWTTLVGPNRGDELHRRSQRALEMAGPAGLVIALDRLQAYALARAEPPGQPSAEIVDGSELAAALEALPAEAELAARVDARLAAGRSVVLVADRVLIPRLFGERAVQFQPRFLDAMKRGHAAHDVSDERGQVWAILLAPSPAASAEGQR